MDSQITKMLPLPATITDMRHFEHKWKYWYFCLRMKDKLYIVGKVKLNELKEMTNVKDYLLHTQ